MSPEGHFEAYELFGDSGLHRWRLESDGQTVAVSRLAFSGPIEAWGAAARFVTLSRELDYVVFEGGGRWYWSAQTAHGERLAFAGVEFWTRELAQSAGDRVRRIAAEIDASNDRSGLPGPPQTIGR
ncbi:MAG: hypothetical protein ACJ762_07275 [Solirubrobacteraceae bacterium]